MAGSTWTWLGGTINVASSSDWTLTAGAGSLTGIPLTGDTAVNPGTLVGYGLIAAALVNSGTIVASNNAVPGSSTGGTLEIQGAVSGTGSITLAAGATLRIDGTLGVGQTIAFNAGAPETLILGSTVGSLANPITGFVAGDKIVLANGGTVYPPTLTTLVRFNGTNGKNPYAGLIVDSAGDLFGTTYQGGASNDGTVFEIAKTGGG